MYGDDVAGSYSFDGTDDEDDDDNDDVEHDVKDDLIVDSRRRPEQHNIMSSTTVPQQEARQRVTLKNFKNGRCGVDAVRDMKGGGEDQNKCS